MSFRSLLENIKFSKAETKLLAQITNKYTDVVISGKSQKDSLNSLQKKRKIVVGSTSFEDGVMIVSIKLGR